MFDFPTKHSIVVCSYIVDLFGEAFLLVLLLVVPSKSKVLWKQDLISILSTKPNKMEFVGLEKVREKRRNKKEENNDKPAWFGLVDKK